MYDSMSCADAHIGENTDVLKYVGGAGGTHGEEKHKEFIGG